VTAIIRWITSRMVAICGSFGYGSRRCAECWFGRGMRVWRFLAYPRLLCQPAYARRVFDERWADTIMTRRSPYLLYFKGLRLVSDSTSQEIQTRAEESWKCRTELMPTPAPQLNQLGALSP